MSFYPPYLLIQPRPICSIGAPSGSGPIKWARGIRATGVHEKALWSADAKVRVVGDFERPLAYALA